MGGPKYRTHQSVKARATVTAVLSDAVTHTWYKVPQHTMLQMSTFVPSSKVNPKRSIPTAPLNRKVFGKTDGGLGLGVRPRARQSGHWNVCLT
eukprot:10191507-Lingulodinium_polyedra.AAC.1